jgi:hypothetical protein
LLHDILGNINKGAKMDVWVGIDPGKKGAISSVNRRGQLIDCIPMDGDPRTILKLVENNQNEIRHIFIEKAQCITGQGVRGIFTYAEEYGILQGILIGSPKKIPFTLCPARVWQKTMFLGTKAMFGLKKRDPKDRALEAANRIFAKNKSFWLKSKRCTKPHDGMFDSALIAEFCRREIG